MGKIVTDDFDKIIILFLFFIMTIIPKLRVIESREK